MEIIFVIYLHMHKSGTVLYLLYENHTTELMVPGQVHTMLYLIDEVVF